MSHRVQVKRQRTISDLTHQQLQHKRDLDRKAQRALRQRTKSRIDDLEQELERLKESSSKQEAELMKQNEVLQEHNRLLSERIEQIRQLTFVTEQCEVEDSSENVQHSASEEVAAAGDRVVAAVDPGPEHPSPRITAVNGTSGTNGPLQDNDLDLTGTQQHIQAVPVNVILSPGQRDVVYGDDWYDVNQPADSQSVTRSRSAPRSVEYMHEPYRRLSHTPTVVANDSSAGKGPDLYLDGMTPAQRKGTQSSTITMGISPESLTSPSSSFSRWTNDRDREVYAVLCQHLSATCPLDQILLDFLTSRRALLAEGTPMNVLIGPVQPVVSAMIHPDGAPSTHPISRVMSEILSTFGHVRLQERLAFMFLMFNTMRWQISPTDENYSRLPSWLRPTAKQITKKHAAWIDNIPWPGVRDLLITHPDKYPFVVFSEMYSHHVTINWPYDPMDSVISTGPPNSGETLNPIFEKHIRRLSNWTVSREFSSFYPEMTVAIFERD